MSCVQAALAPPQTIIPKKGKQNMSGRQRRRYHTEDDREFLRSPNPTRFYRSRRDKVIGGVCGGLADRFSWDPLLVRVAAILMFLMSGFFPLGVIYIMVMILTPYRPTGYARERAPDEDAFWRGVSDRPRATFSQMKYTFMDLEDRLQRMERKVTSEEWRLRKEFRDLDRQ